MPPCYRFCSARDRDNDREIDACLHEIWKIRREEGAFCTAAIIIGILLLSTCCAVTNTLSIWEGTTIIATAVCSCVFVSCPLHKHLGTLTRCVGAMKSSSTLHLTYLPYKTLPVTFTEGRPNDRTRFFFSHERLLPPPVPPSPSVGCSYY